MSRANKRDTRPEEKVDAAPAAPADTAQVEAQAAANLEVKPEDVTPQGSAAATAPQPDEDHTEAAAQPGLPDHLAHRVSLEEYSRLRGLNAFGQAHLTRAVGAYDRPFEEWEAARQNVIGG